MTQTLRELLMASVLVGAAPLLVAGQQAQPQETSQEWLAKRTAELESYKFTSDGSPSAELALEPRSLLNWSNAERGTAAGAVFLWTQSGQPAMIANR